MGLNFSGVTMIYLIAGLIVFLGVHSVRIFAEDWRTRTITRIGENPWKGIYSLISIAGFVLLVWGYGEARQQGIVLYEPPVFTRHIAGLLMLISLILIAAAKVPRNHIKASLGHPMIIGVKVWAFSHLLANGRLADVVLFGAFLAWAVVDFIAARKRDCGMGTVYPPGGKLGTGLTLLAGLILWVVFVAGLHRWLIGVPPFVRG
jgi:uncharacterized membrane protein